MFDLKMAVYTPELEMIGLLETYQSLLFREEAFSAGSFTVECPVTPEVRELLVKENIIWFQDSSAGIIEYIYERRDADGPYITVKGRLLAGILDRRILWGRYDFTGTPEAIMRRLVEVSAVKPENPARVIPGLSIDSGSSPGGAAVIGRARVGRAYVGGDATERSTGAAIRKQKTGGSLLEALTELGEAYNVAFGVRFDPWGPRMVFWARPGIDRSVGQSEPVFFSNELDDVLRSEYTYDSSDYRNITLVAGEGEGDSRTMVTVIGDIGEGEV